MPRRNWPSAERSLPLELMRALVGDALEGKYGKREERQFDSAFDLSVKEAMGARGERGLVGKLVPVIGFVSDVRNHVITLCLIEKYWHAPEDGMDAYVQVHVSRSRARDGESHGSVLYHAVFLACLFCPLMRAVSCSTNGRMLPRDCPRQ